MSRLMDVSLPVLSHAFFPFFVPYMFSLIPEDEYGVKQGLHHDHLIAS